MEPILKFVHQEVKTIQYLETINIIVLLSRLKTRFEAGEFESGILLGDSGYPLKSYLLPSLPNPITRGQQLYNESQIRTSNYIERTKEQCAKKMVSSIVLRFSLQFNQCPYYNCGYSSIVQYSLEYDEDIPPLPEGINAAELDYLVEQGQIPDANLHQHLLYDFRGDIVINHFDRL